MAVWCFLLMIFTGIVSAGLPSEDSIMRELFSDYNPLVYPGSYNDTAVTVGHGLSLINIVEVDKKKLVLDVWEYWTWTDPRLVWKGNPSSMRIPTSKIWMPDIVYFNRPGKRDFVPYAVVNSDGKIAVMPATRLETRYVQLPDGLMVCYLKYGSWTYSGNLINLQLLLDSVCLFEYLPSASYQLVNTTAERTATKYNCCPEEYLTVLYSISIKPKD